MVPTRIVVGVICRRQKLPLTFQADAHNTLRANGLHGVIFCHVGQTLCAGMGKDRDSELSCFFCDLRNRGRKK